jgi:predicted TIM-barrel fold metal-dependent hydrolase
MAIAASEWLALTVEEILEPELSICDPHHHLWDHPESRYLAEELATDTSSGHRITSTVFVECGSGYRSVGPPSLSPVGESEFVEDLVARVPDAHPTRVAAAIVGHADLLLGSDVDAVLEAHRAASPRRFRGVRHSAAWDASDEIRRSHSDPPPSMLLRDEFREGFARLAGHDLRFEAWLFHPQIPELTDLAKAFPGTPIVLDHVGGPLGIGPFAGRREEILESWRADMAALASCSNVMVKLGGLAMPINGFGWHKGERPPSSLELADSFAPYFQHCIEQFGAERCMFESNFPVDKASCSYAILWNSFKRVVSDRTLAEKAALFHDNAARFYHLRAD